MCKRFLNCRDIYQHCYFKTFLRTEVVTCSEDRFQTSDFKVGELLPTKIGSTLISWGEDLERLVVICAPQQSVVNCHSIWHNFQFGFWSFTYEFRKPLINYMQLWNVSFLCVFLCRKPPKCSEQPV